MRKLVRIGSNVKITGDSHYKNKNIVLTLLKKIEMRKMTMPNFCINFLNKAAKSLSILYDFAVASLADAWNCYTLPKILSKCSRIFPYKKVHYTIIVYRIPRECVD